MENIHVTIFSLSFRAYCRTERPRETLRSIARELTRQESESESEDELEPDDKFVARVEEMHRDNVLGGWVKMSHDASINPLLTVVNNGQVTCADVTNFERDYPRFYQDWCDSGKKHGCFMFLSNFIHRNYPIELYDEPSLLLSQLQYLQIAIRHTVQ